MENDTPTVGETPVVPLPSDFFGRKNAATPSVKTPTQAAADAPEGQEPTESIAAKIEPASEPETDATSNTADEPETDSEAAPEEEEGPKTFDAAYVKELREESSRYRTRAKEAEAARDVARSEVTRYKVAFEQGLTADDLPFLKGSEEEMTALAARLKASMSAPQHAGVPASAPTDPNVAASQALGFGIPAQLVSNPANPAADASAAARAFFGL